MVVAVLLILYAKKSETAWRVYVIWIGTPLFLRPLFRQTAERISTDELLIFIFGIANFPKQSNRYGIGFGILQRENRLCRLSCKIWCVLCSCTNIAIVHCSQIPSANFCREVKNRCAYIVNWIDFKISFALPLLWTIIVTIIVLYF